MLETPQKPGPLRPEPIYNAPRASTGMAQPPPTPPLQQPGFLRPEPIDNAPYHSSPATYGASIAPAADPQRMHASYGQLRRSRRCRRKRAYDPHALQAVKSLQPAFKLSEQYQPPDANRKYGAPQRVNQKGFLFY